MFIEKAFKTLFPGKASQMETMTTEFEQLSVAFAKVYQELNAVRENPEPKATMADLMRESIGLPMLDFTDADGSGHPPLPYENLDTDRRKAYVANLQSVYATEEFQEMYRFMINLFANNSMLMDGDDKIKNGRIAIVAMKAFMRKMEDAHAEFLKNNEKPEEFDPLDTMPE